VTFEEAHCPLPVDLTQIRASEKPHTCVRDAGHMSGQRAEGSRRSGGGIAAVSPFPGPNIGRR